MEIGMEQVSGFRWQVIDDQVVIDNRPIVEQERQNWEARTAHQFIVIPLSVFSQINMMVGQKAII